MIALTKEQLIASAHARIEFSEMMLAGELEPLKERTWSIELELARIALASLEAEAVGYFGRFYADDEDLIDQCSHNISGAFPLYTAPPAPVSVPDEITSANAPEVFEIAAEAERLGLRGAYASYAVGWNACRAAMLQSFGNSEQLNSPVIPDGWIKCSERVPEENGPVLVHQEGGVIFCAEYEDGDGFYPDEFPNVPKQGREITHWMPLPQPPALEA